MEKKVTHTNDKLKSQDKPGFHRATGKQHALTEKEKKDSKRKAANKENTVEEKRLPSNE